MKNFELLQNDSYYFTIRQAYHKHVKTSNPNDVNIGILCFTVDKGKYTWRNLIVEFSLHPKYMSYFERFCKSINYNPIGNPLDDDYFNQFIGQRCKGDVVVTTKGNVMINRITNFDIADKKTDVNVCEPRKTEHFFKQKQKRVLNLL